MGTQVVNNPRTPDPKKIYCNQAIKYPMVQVEIDGAA
jgi:hypothetical protein